MIEDIGYVFIYLSAFGLSEYTIRILGLEGLAYVLYQLALLAVGATLVVCARRSKKQKQR